MPSNENAPNPVEGSGAQTDSVDTSAHDTPRLSVPMVQAGLLRGLLAYPAKCVLEVTATLDQNDLPDAAYQLIMHTVVQAARALQDAGEGDKQVSPVAVQVALQDSGELSNGVTASAMLEVSTGNPPALYEVKQLANALRTERLRRVAGDVGHALVVAVDGSHDDLVTALHRIALIPPVARRAGLEVAL